MTDITSLVGKLYYVEGSQSFILEQDGGEAVDVYFKKASQGWNTPHQRRLILFVEHDNRVVDTDPWFTLLPEQPGENVPRRLWGGIWKKVELDSSDESIAEAKAHAQDIAYLVQRDFETLLPNWDIDIRGFSVRTDQYAGKPNFMRTDIKANLAMQDDLGEWVPTNYMAWGDYFKTRCGEAELNGKWGGVSGYPPSCDHVTFEHEFGHQLNMGHASTLDHAGYRVAYGDKTSIMGSGQTRRGLNSPQAVYLGLESSREIHTITHSEQVFLAPIELEPDCLRANEYQHLVVVVGRKSYYVSLRKTKGHPHAVLQHPSHVYVHTWDSHRDTTRFVPDAVPGTDWEHPEVPFKLIYREYTRECARVSVVIDDVVPEDLPVPPPFPAPLAISQIKPVHQGLWFNRKHTGQGFHVVVANGRCAVFWYTYNEDGTERRFYLGAADIINGAAHFMLQTTEGDVFDDPTQADKRPCGTAQIQFTSDTGAIFDYSTEEHGRGRIYLEPLDSEDGKIGGAWYDPSRNNEGMSLHHFPSRDDKLIGYWFTYGPGQVGKNNTQRWFEVHFTHRVTHWDCEIFEAQGGLWRQKTDVTMKSVGSGELHQVDDKLQFDFTIRTGINKTGRINFKRLL